MLNEFRALSRSFLAKLLLMFLVISFGVWGIGDIMRHPGGNATIATVGGTTITAIEFQHALRNAAENMRSQFGDKITPETLKQMQVPEQVLQQLIDRRLIRLESKALGLIASDDDVVRHIRDDSTFQDNNGKFDKKIFELWLTRTGQAEKAYIEQRRNDISADMLLSTLLLSTPVSEEAVRTLYDAREEQRTATFYTLSASAMPASPAPPDKELNAYYATHSKQYNVPEYRTVSYLVLSPKDVEGSAISEQALRAAYKERSDEFKHSERRSVDQLLYASKEKADAAAALLKSGKAFADVAKTTDVENKEALSLGKVEKNGIMENAADAVFALKTGESTAPFQDAFGWHIFHVSAIEPPSVAPFEEVRPLLEKDARQHAADTGLNDLANKLEDAIAGGATLPEAAKELKLTLHTVGPFGRYGDAPDGSKVTDIPNFEKFTDVAFKTEEKSESALIPLKNGTYYMMQVDNVAPEHLRPIAEMKSQVLAGWQKEQQLEKLAKISKTIAIEFGNPATRAATIEKYHLQQAATATIRHDSNTAGSVLLPEPLVADIFTLQQPGDSTSAYRTPNDELIVASLVSVTAAPAPESSAKSRQAMDDIRKGLHAAKQNEMVDEYASYLMRRYSVWVNKAAFESMGP